jgi:antitoxin component YwqK of YwqJK toxin-antitoxin module
MSGTKRTSGKMYQDKMEGKWTFWYHNNQKESEMYFNGGQVTKGKVWNDNGTIKVKRVFEGVILRKPIKYKGSKSNWSLSTAAEAAALSTGKHDEI